MTKSWIITGTVAVLLLGTVVLTTPASATKPIAEKEGLSCTACHDKPGSKRFTDRGKFYELMGDFDGYEALTAKFGQCTTCHKRRPGSTKLTIEGKRWAEIHGTMEALCKQALEERKAGSGKAAADGPDGTPDTSDGGGAPR